MNLWSCAVHESGHATMCQLLGGTVKGIEVFDRPTLDPYGRRISGRCRIVAPKEPLTWAMIYVGGPLSERMVVSPVAAAGGVKTSSAVER